MASARRLSTPVICNLHRFGSLVVITLDGGDVLQFFKNFSINRALGSAIVTLFQLLFSSDSIRFPLGKKMTIVEVESSLESSGRGGDGVGSGDCGDYGG